MVVENILSLRRKGSMRRTIFRRGNHEKTGSF
jgi:hypothetical protein